MCVFGRCLESSPNLKFPDLQSEHIVYPRVLIGAEEVKESMCDWFGLGVNFGQQYC